MALHSLKEFIERAWNHPGEVDSQELKYHLFHLLDFLEDGTLRVSMPNEGGWHPHIWIKQGILLCFKLFTSDLIKSDTTGPWYDKIPLKFRHWDEMSFISNKIRAVPGAIVRRGAYIGKNVILMPSFINIGAYIDNDTMIDTWATIGSCAQIGKYCHISGGVGIGGVLEPLQDLPVIIEDGCFIGARSEIAEGMIIRKGSVIAMGTYLSSSTKIIHRATGKITYGEIPSYSVVVPGTYQSEGKPYGLQCAMIVKTTDSQTRSKTAINELLRI